MAEKKRKKKGTISEDSTYQLLQRYSASTIITLLQEVSRFADVKIDWKAIVKTSATGISNPREYQLLWRHLAYCEPLLDNVDGTEPADDDSDLEFELEAEPAVGAEVPEQVATSVKALMASYVRNSCVSTRDSAGKGHTYIDRCNAQASTSRAEKEQPARSACGKNITPVSLHKQAALTKSIAEGLDGNEATDSSLANKKKRKFWSPQEDEELKSAVQKHGVGNWLDILKDFKHERTPTQLSQRWTILRKRPGSLSNITQTERLDATREAVASAFKMPMARTPSVIGLSSTSQLSTPKLGSTTLEPPRPQSSNPAQPPLNQATAPPPLGPNPTLKPLLGPSPIQAAVLAAGGRQVPPSTAMNLFKTAQSKNVHIINRGSLIISKGRVQPSFRKRPLVMPPIPTQPAARVKASNEEENAERVSGPDDGEKRADAVVSHDERKDDDEKS